MFGASKDLWYNKYGVHVIAVIIVITAFTTAFFYSLSHKNEFYEIVKNELSTYSESKINTLNNIIIEKKESVERDVFNLIKIYNLYNLDTLYNQHPLVKQFYYNLYNKIEPDRLGFIILESLDKKIIFTVNKNNLPLSEAHNIIPGYYDDKGSAIWKNELIYTDYNLSMRVPINNINNKVIGYFRVGLKSDFISKELNNPVILGDKKLSVLIYNISRGKFNFSVKNDNIDLDFFRKQTELNSLQNNVGKLTTVTYKQDTEVIIYSRALKNSNWVIIFSLDTASLSEHLDYSKYSIFMVALIFSIVTVLSIEILFKRITRKTISTISEKQKEQVGYEQLKEIIKQSILEVQLLIDKDGTIIVHNENLIDVYGFNGGLINSNFCDLFIDIEKEKINKAITLKTIGDKGVLKSICKKKNGNKFNVSIEFEVYSFLGKNYYYLFIQDITSLIESENKIIEAERIYFTLLSNLPGMVYRSKIDKDWTMTFISNGCKELTGYEPDEILFNSKVTYNSLILDEYKDFVWNFTEEAIKNKKQYSYEYKIKTKNNEIKWVYEKGIAVYDETGMPKFLEGFISDISERKKIETRLIANTEKYLSIFENSAAGKTIMSVEGNFMEVNSSFCNMLGYMKEEIVGKNYSLFTHPDDIVRSKNALKTTIDNKNLSFHLVKRYIHKNGNVIYAKISLSMLYDKNFNPMFIISDVLDITTEIRIRTELAESEERYKLLAESAQEGIFLLNSEFKLEFVNYYAAKIINPNLEIEALINGQNYKTIFNIPIEEFKKVINERAIKNVDTELIINGEKKYFETKLVPIIDEKNKVKSILGIARDETESRDLVTKLNESTTMLNTIINSVPQRIFWKDKNCYYLGCNHNFALDGGLSSVSEIIGKNDYELPWKELADFYVEDDKEVMESSIPMLDKIEELIKSDGTKVWISTSKVPLKNIEGKTIGVLGIFEDVTKKKIFEEQLQDTLYKLETSNKELEQFAYVASHDLQEPLRMVASYTQLLEQRYKNKLDEQADQYIHFAVDGAKRMQKLIDDLLEYSRVTTKGKEFVNVNLSEVMGKVMVALSSKIHETGAVVVNGSLPIVFGDETQIIRLLQNLIDNSIKYSGGKQPTIFIMAEDLNDKYLFKVRDNGIGIPFEYKDRIFEIFERLHTVNEYPGTGIGLSICKRIIDRHGGRIWLDETVTDGAQFCFTLNKGRK
ncbi:MAG TPA: PAS domain S-box protein [Melioribacteraceae bacterium]|nr:PAS domain S-box protein [Melioribacteraceae bacterium]